MILNINCFWSGYLWWLFLRSFFSKCRFSTCGFSSSCCLSSTCRVLSVLHGGIFASARVHSSCRSLVWRRGWGRPVKVELLVTCQYLCGTILVATYSIVWYLRVSRAGPMPFYWQLRFYFLPFSLSVISFNGLVLWCWSRWNDNNLIPWVAAYARWLPRMLKVTKLQDRIPAAATCQLDLQSLTPFSIAICDRLQLGVPHCDTSVDYCK